MAYGKKKMRKLYPGKGCSLTACGDHELELSPMFGNCLVKRLPQGQLFGCLRRHKRHLQTAGLICREDRRPELMKTLASGGVARITGQEPCHRHLRERHMTGNMPAKICKICQPGDVNMDKEPQGG
mgnify:CR=1 FL=1